MPDVSSLQERALRWLPPLLAVLAFLPGVANEFIYDDNPLLRERLADGVRWSSFWLEDYWADDSGLYRPLTLVLARLERIAFGLSPVGFHIVSLTLHALCAGLFAVVARRLVGWRLAFGAACLFAVHPLHAEAVLPAYGQADLLAAVFVLLAVERVTAGVTRGHLALATLYALLAALCKETGLLAFPLAWIVIAWRKTVDAGALRLGPGHVLWMAVAPVGYFVLRVAMIGKIFVGSERAFTSEFDTVTRAKLVLVSLAETIRLSFAPWGQTPNYAHLRDVLAGPIWVEAALLALALLLAWGLSEVAQGYVVGFSVAWFAVGVLPVLNLVPIGTLVAERSLYLPSAGAALLLAAALGAIAKPRIRIAALACVCVLGVALSARLAVAWQNEVSLWWSVTADHPRSPQAHSFLGNAYLLRYDAARETATSAERDEMLRQADRALRRAVELNPKSATALRGMGIAALLRGQAAEAMQYLSRAQSLNSNDVYTQRYLLEARQQLDAQRAAQQKK